MFARFGARATLVRIMVLWGLCSMALAAMSAPLHYYVLRFALGAAEAGLFPGVLLYLSYWTPPEWRTRFTALFVAAMPIAGIAGGPLSGLLLTMLDGPAGLANWQWLFLIEGVPALALGIAAWLLLSDRPECATWLDKGELARLQWRLSSQAPPTRHDGSRAFFAQPRFYAFSIMSIALIAGIGGLALWFPSATRESGVNDPLIIGLLGILPYAFGLVVQQAIALRAPGPRSAAVAAVLASGGWLCAAVTHSPSGVVLGFCIAAAGMFGATAPFWAVVTTTFQTRSAPLAIAAITTVGGVGGFIAPSIVGALTAATGGMVWGLGFYALLMLIGAISIMSSPRREC